MSYRITFSPPTKPRDAAMADGQLSSLDSGRRETVFWWPGTLGAKRRAAVSLWWGRRASDALQMPRSHHVASVHTRVKFEPEGGR